MRKCAFLLFCFLVLFALPLAAQGATGFTLDDSVIAQILAILAGGGIAGAFVAWVVNALKQWLKISGGWKAIVLAVLSSAGVTAGVLAASRAFEVWSFLGYSLMVFLISSGYYHRKDDKLGNGS